MSLGRNHKRARAARDQDFGDEAETVRKLPCSVPGCEGYPCDPAHVKSRGAGGGRFDIIPLCNAHHREQHDHGVKTFAAKYSLDLRAEADRIAVMHSGPLGLRALALHWQARLRNLGPVELDKYERHALLGFARRTIERSPAVTRGGKVWAVRDLLEVSESTAWAICDAAEAA